MAITRTYDNFMAFVPSADAVLFSGRQLEIGSSAVVRQNAGATASSELVPSGNHLTLAPAGREGRAPRLQLLTSRGDPESMIDVANDAQRGQVLITPRYRL